MVNPVAGLGGAVGLKGSDGTPTQAEARRRGAVGRSADRARRALSIVVSLAPRCEIVTTAGPLGTDALPDGAKATVLPGRVGPVTTAQDTRRVCASLLEAGIDLLLFAGGDGTARDVLDAVGTRCPVLGVPAGVKMYSAVFGTSPVTAGRTAAGYLTTGTRCLPADVLDLDEAAVRAGLVRPRIYGMMDVPFLPGLQGRKVGSSPDDAADAVVIAAAVLDDMREAEVVLLGPGTTIRAVAQRLGVDGTLTGVDALDLASGRLLAKDAGERELLAAVTGRPTRVLLSPLGGQGFLLGRGDQQVSAAVFRETGPGALTVLATKRKLAALGGRALWIDTGDAAMDRSLAGMHRVVTGPQEFTMYPVQPADDAS